MSHIFACHTSENNYLAVFLRRDTDQLAFYKYDLGYDPRSTEKQLQWSERDLDPQPPAPQPLGHTASISNLLDK